MVATTIDTLLSCFVMVTLVLTSMVGVYTVVHPFLQEQQSLYKMQVNQKLAEYILLGPGYPVNWGSDLATFLTDFGLAEYGSVAPYELDIDKVTRLNSENAYNVSFLDVFSALGTQDKPFRITIKPVFDVSVNLTSKQEGPTETVYHFQISTERSSLPIAADLCCYAVFSDQVVSNASSTSNAGEGSVDVTLQNEGSGTALFIVIAKADSKTASYAVYPFAHQSSSNPNSQGAYATLSPIDYTLRIDLVSDEDKMSHAMIMTYSNWFSLSEINESQATMFYELPRLLDPSPMVVVGTGLDGSTSFAEWTVYPQVPVVFGSNFTGEGDLLDSYAFRYLVTINSAVYECEVVIGGA